MKVLLESNNRKYKQYGLKNIFGKRSIDVCFKFKIYIY